MDAGHAKFFDACQQVVQAVAGFVEEGGDIIVREGGRLAANWGREVAVEVGDGLLDAFHAAGEYPASGDGIVHPGAAAFGIAGIEVEVELADQLTGWRFDAEKAHIVMPGGRVVGL